MAGTLVSNYRRAPTGDNLIARVHGPLLNSRGAFRAQSQLALAILSARDRYVHVSEVTEQAAAGLLATAYGRIMVPVPEGHYVHCRSTQFTRRPKDTLIYVRMDDPAGPTFASKFVSSFAVLPDKCEAAVGKSSLGRGWECVDAFREAYMGEHLDLVSLIEELTLLVCRDSIECSRAFDGRMGFDVGVRGEGGSNGRRHVVLDLRVDRLDVWPVGSKFRPVVFRQSGPVSAESGSQLYRFLVGVGGRDVFFCKITVHIVRIGPRKHEKRRWGTIDASGRRVKPHDVKELFAYPSASFVQDREQEF